MYGKGDVGRCKKEFHEFGGVPHDQINKIREHFGDDVGWYVCVNVSTCPRVSTYPRVQGSMGGGLLCTKIEIDTADAH